MTHNMKIEIASDAKFSKHYNSNETRRQFGGLAKVSQPSIWSRIWAWLLADA
jgi:hypothetical protein